MNDSSSKSIGQLPFSFHCTICYETLNLTDRAPMVLPCGHTYICEPCTGRLDRCMECRMPLTIQVAAPGGREEEPSSSSSSRTVPRTTRSGGLYGHRNQQLSRYSHGGTMGQRPTEPIRLMEKVRIPIAKNHVLMSLLEAALQERVTGAAMDDAGYDSGEEDELVLRGIRRVLSYTAGTYRVREKNGLHVYSKPPTENTTANDESNESFIRTLKYSQTVQISRFEGNIAVIARGVGYIFVSMPSQLVKVGALLNETCKLEAMGEAIQDEMVALETKVERLRKSLGVVDQRKRTRSAEMTSSSRDEDVFGPEPVEEALRLEKEKVSEKERVSSNYSRDGKDSMIPSQIRPRPILKRPNSKRSNLVTQSSQQQTSTLLQCMPLIEPSRSFDDLARFFWSPVDENEQKRETLFSRYLSSFWNDDNSSSNNTREDDTESTKSTTSRLTQSSSCPSIHTIDQRRRTTNYASGYSGHVGLNTSTRHRHHVQQNRRVRMMSHY